MAVTVLAGLVELPKVRHHTMAVVVVEVTEQAEQAEQQTRLMLVRRQQIPVVVVVVEQTQMPGPLVDQGSV